MGVDPEVPRGMAGDHPAFDIPEHPSRDAAKQGADGAGRAQSARVGEVDLSDLPVHDVTTARAKAAERESSGWIVEMFRMGRPLCVSRPQIDVHPGGAMKQGSRFVGDSTDKSSGVEGGIGIRKASHRVLSVS
jgi:hypothetical protein